MAEPTIQELQQQLADARKLAERAEYLESESKKAFAERDEAKKKARELEEAEQKRKDGELSELEREKKAKSELERQLADATGKAKAYEDFLAKRKDDLKKKAGDKWVTGWETLPLDVLETTIDTVIPKSTPKVPKGGNSDGEPTLEQQLVEAQKSGNTILAVTLKRLISERDRKAA